MSTRDLAPAQRGSVSLALLRLETLAGLCSVTIASAGLSALGPVACSKTFEDNLRSGATSGAAGTNVTPMSDTGGSAAAGATTATGGMNPTAGGMPPVASTSVGGSGTGGADPAGVAGALTVSGTAGAAMGSTSGAAGMDIGVAGEAGTPTVNGSPAGGAGGMENMAGAGGSSAGAGGAEVDTGPISGHVMAIEYPGRIVEISAEGEVLWEYRTPALSIMFQPLPNGDVFFPVATNPPGAMIVDRDRNVVWSVERPVMQILGGEYLETGNILLGEQGPPRVVELDMEMNEVRSINVSTTTQDAHRQIRRVRALQNGNVLVALEGENAVRELDSQGQTVWEFTGVQSAHDAVRLDNGNTLIGGGTSKRVIEVDPQGQVVWEFGEADGPELSLNWITNVQPLPSGNLLVCNFVGETGGDGVHAFEVTRDKEVVWTLDDHQLLRSATTVLSLD